MLTNHIKKIQGVWWERDFQHYTRSPPQSPLNSSGPLAHSTGPQEDGEAVAHVASEEEAGKPQRSKGRTR